MKPHRYASWRETGSLLSDILRAVSRRFLAFCFLASALHAQVTWHQHAAGAAIPGDAVVLEETRAGPLLLARIERADGSLHPAAAIGGVATISFKGGVEQSERFQFARSGTVAWVAPGSALATPVGRSHATEIFLCRAPILIGPLPVAWAYGKAYCTGVHAGRAYVAFQGREIELTKGYELLSLPSSSRPVP